MKVKGITRKLDNLGRIVIPKEFRKTLNIEEGDNLEMVLTKDGVLLKTINDTSKLESYTDRELINELKNRGLIK